MNVTVGHVMHTSSKDVLGSVVASQALEYKLLNNARPDLVELVGAGFCQLSTLHSRGPHLVYLASWAGLALLLIPVICRLLVMSIGFLQTETHLTICLEAYCGIQDPDTHQAGQPAGLRSILRRLYARKHCLGLRHFQVREQLPIQDLQHSKDLLSESSLPVTAL